MKNKLIIAAGVIPFATFAQYVSVVNDNSYSVVSDVFIEISEWSTISTNCTTDISEDDVYFGLTKDQTKKCSSQQERTKTKTKINEDGSKEVISVDTENQTIQENDEILSITGTHLENSCHKIIVNNYANTDGVYKIGNSADYFNVFCDMRGDEGWTLISKVPVGDGFSAGSIPLNWFQIGYNSNAMMINTFSYNESMASVGIDKIEKIGHTGLSELQFISEDQTQGVPYYKTITNNNIKHWFSTTEPTATQVCTDTAMTQNCESSAFEYWSNRYWLRGVDLRKYGFDIIDEVLQDVHFNLHGNITNPTLCSVTGNLNNNAWHDSASDGHWGNGLVVYIK